MPGLAWLSGAWFLTWEVNGMAASMHAGLNVMDPVIQRKAGNPAHGGGSTGAAGGPTLVHATSTGGGLPHHPPPRQVCVSELSE
jgi:hypothetical protein